MFNERVDAGRMDPVSVRAALAKLDELVELRKGVVIPRGDYFKSQDMKVSAMAGIALNESQKTWRDNYAKELDEGIAWINEQTKAIEIELANVQQMMNN